MEKSKGFNEKTRPYIIIETGLKMELTYLALEHLKGKDNYSLTKEQLTSLLSKIAEKAVRLYDADISRECAAFIKSEVEGKG